LWKSSNFNMSSSKLLPLFARFGVQHVTGAVNSVLRTGTGNTTVSSLVTRQSESFMTFARASVRLSPNHSVPVWNEAQMQPAAGSEAAAWGNLFLPQHPSRKERKPRLPEEIPPAEPRPATEKSKRCGAIAVKLGMTRTWDSYGAMVPLTALWIDDCQVIQTKTEINEGYNALQVGTGYRKPKNTSKAKQGHFDAAGTSIKRKLWEFKTSPDGLMPPGTEIRASHFVAGQYVDLTGVTKGKGFAGVMKRWGFKGQPASHGNTKAHRKMGSTGGCQDPGKVFKGKKMPGKMGNKQRTVQSCWVYKIDPEKNVIFVKGQVPGNKGCFVMIKDALRKPPAAGSVPFPTAFLEEGKESWADVEPTIGTPDKDPYIIYRRKN